MVPSETIYHHERAKAYQMIDYHQEATDDFNLVIKKNPKNAHAYFRRAFSLKALKNFEKAAKGFEKALKLDPLNPHLVINHKKLKGVKCIVLCKPGEEKVFLD
jgi:Flp pilus assembly protein TadD